MRSITTENIYEALHLCIEFKVFNFKFSITLSDSLLKQSDSKKHIKGIVRVILLPS